MKKICTSIEQSKKLIELGLDVNTADMAWDLLDGDEVNEKIPYCYPDRFDTTIEEFIPSWSLTALMNLLPSEFTQEGKFRTSKYEIKIRKYKLTKDVDVYQIAYGDYIADEDFHYHWKDMINTAEHESLLDAAVDMFVWLKENKML